MTTRSKGITVTSELETAARKALEEAGKKGRFESVGALQDVHTYLLAVCSEATFDEANAPPAVLDDQEQFLRLGVATGAFLDEKQDRREVQGLLDYWYTVQYREGRRPSKPRLAPLDEKLFSDLENVACPYRGLDAYREIDRPYFFGREALCGELLAKLADSSILAVVGSSGSGKSSVVRAGLVPDLRTGKLPGSASWHILPLFAPGSLPLESLAMAAGDDRTDALGSQPSNPALLESTRQLAKELREDPRRLALRLNRSDGLPVVLVIDQFEEVFTLCKNLKDARCFVEALLELVRTDAGAAVKNRLILTMRSDFQVHLQKYPDLRDLFRAGRILVSPMNTHELHEAIERPAKQVGLVFEKGVVEKLVEDTYSEPTALPLLQLALLKLWDDRWRNKVTMAAYRRLGDSREAIPKAAEELYNHMSDDDKETAKLIFLRIVRPGEGLEVSSKRIPIGDLLPPNEDHARTKQVLNKLVEARLMRVTPGIRDEDTQFELAHDLIVRNWPRLVDWLGEERAAIVARQRLELKVAEWARRGRGQNALLDEAQLPEAQAWLESNDAAVLGDIPGLRDLVKASAQAIRDRNRASKGAIAALVVFAACAAVAAGIAVRQSEKASREAEKANQAFRQADENYVRFVASKLLQVAKEDTSDSGRRLVLAQKAVAALQSRNLPIPAEVLQTVEGLVRQPALKFDVLSDNRIFLYYSSNGQMLATSTYGTDAGLWNADTGKQLSVLAGTKDDALMAMAFSPDGQHLATADLQGRARIWKISPGGQDPKPVRTLSGGHNGAVYAVTFAPVAQAQNRLATAGEDGMVIVWDGDTGRQISRLSGHTGKVFSVAYAAEGHQLASGGADGTAILWDASLGKPIRVLKHPHGSVTSVALDPSGNYVATVCTDGHAHLWNAANGESVRTFESAKVAWYGGLAFSQDGTLLATSGVERTVTVNLWKIPTGERQLSITVGDNSAQALAFRPDLSRFAIACSPAEASSATIQSQDQSAQTVKIFEIRKIDNLLESMRAPERRELTADDFREILKELAPNNFDQMLQAEKLAKNNDAGGAITKIKDALNLPGLDLEIDRESRRLVADFLIDRGRTLASEGKSDEAVAKFVKAQDLDKERSIDPQAEARRYEAFGRFKEGERLSAQGDYERGAQEFRKGKALNDRYTFDPDSLAKKLAAPAMVNRGLRLVRQGKVAEAVKAFQDASSFDPKVEITATSWNNLCWFGSLFGKAADVLFAGERAVQLATPEEVNSFRDTRGLARALTGQFQGAVEDFEAFVNWAKSDPERASEKEIADRLRWIKELKANKNPFDKNELERVLQKDLEQ